MSNNKPKVPQPPVADTAIDAVNAAVQTIAPQVVSVPVFVCNVKHKGTTYLAGGKVPEDIDPTVLSSWVENKWAEYDALSASEVATAEARTQEAINETTNRAALNPTE